MHHDSQSISAGYAFEADYISIQGHDLQDVLLRIGMAKDASRFCNLWVKLNPFVDCSSPAFLAEVWGVETPTPGELQCLYVAPQKT